MRKYTIIAGFCFHLLNGQTTIDYNSINFEVVRKINNVNEDLLINKDIQGSAYRNKSFQNGKILTGKKEDANWYIRYNIYSDEMEISRNKNLQKSQKILLKIPEISCFIGDEKFLYKTYVNLNGKKAQGYLIEIHNAEKYILYKKEIKIFREARKAKTSLESDIPAKFIDQAFYLIESKNSFPTAIKLRSKDLYNILDEQDRKFLNLKIGKKIKIKSVDDLITVLGYLNK